EDTSDAAISCQQVGPIELSDKIKNGKAQGEVVFKKRTSLIFKYPVNAVLNVTQAEQTFTFDNVYFQPVPALLCEFSAPVKLEYK
ncbi:CreA family protein, partial [Salmonella enterica subsp. enterica serovar Virginia]|nr:CreA family protein [Salmonella enterica subsp. enterica serovar Virginia]